MDEILVVVPAKILNQIAARISNERWPVVVNYRTGDSGICRVCYNKKDIDEVLSRSEFLNFQINALHATEKDFHIECSKHGKLTLSKVKDMELNNGDTITEENLDTLVNYIQFERGEVW